MNGNINTIESVLAQLSRSEKTSICIAINMCGTHRHRAADFATLKYFGKHYVLECLEGYALRFERDSITLRDLKRVITLVRSIPERNPAQEGIDAAKRDNAARRISERDEQTIMNALRSVAAFYAQLAEQNRGEERIAAQFRKQAAEALELHNRLENDEVTL